MITIIAVIHVYKLWSFSDYKIFCEILVQRPLVRSTIHLPGRMTEKDLDYMRVMAQQHFDKIMDVLKDMPRPMLLIIRCPLVYCLLGYVMLCCVVLCCDVLCCVVLCYGWLCCIKRLIITFSTCASMHSLVFFSSIRNAKTFLLCFQSKLFPVSEIPHNSSHSFIVVGFFSIWNIRILLYYTLESDCKLCI